MAILVSGACKHRSITSTSKCLCLVAMSHGGLKAFDSEAGMLGDSSSSMFSNTFTYFKNGVFFPKLNSVNSIASAKTFNLQISSDPRFVSPSFEQSGIYRQKLNMLTLINPFHYVTEKITSCDWLRAGQLIVDIRSISPCSGWYASVDIYLHCSANLRARVRKFFLV